MEGGGGGWDGGWGGGWGGGHFNEENITNTTNIHNDTEINNYFGEGQELPGMTEESVEVFDGFDGGGGMDFDIGDFGDL